MDHPAFGVLDDAFEEVARQLDEYFARERTSFDLELAPAGTLVGLAKRAMPGVATLAVKTPDDLEAARNLLAKTAETASGKQDDVVVQSPQQGVFTRASGLDTGSRVVGGSRLGTLRTNRDELAVVAPISGILAEWLRNDGDAIGAGLPIARLSYGNEE